MSNQSQDGQERRRSYRIDDQLALVVVPLSDGDMLEAEQRFEGERSKVSLANEFALEEEKLLPTLRQVERKHPDIAKLFASLEKRINIIAQRVSADDGSLPSKPTHKASLGQYGVRFEHPEQLMPGQKIQLHIKFFPSGSHMMVLGIIVDCDPTPAGAWDLAVDFTHIHEADRERLIKHMHNSQMRELRTRHEQSLD